MEPKVIGVISNNLEIVRKICEGRDASTKKTFSDIINGDDVKSIVDAFLDKIGEQTDVIVQLRTGMGAMTRVIKKNSALMNNNDKKEIIDILNTISNNVSAIVQQSVANPKTPENQKMINDILGDVRKDDHTKILLVASLMGKDVVKNLSKIPLFTKLAKKGVKGLDEVLFGDDGDGGLVGIFKKIDKEKNKIKKSSKTIELIAGCTKQIVKIALMMTAMLVLAIPAMLGAVMTAAFVWVYLKVNKLLIDNHKTINKGIIVLDRLMLGLVFMGLSMVLMYKAVEDVEWNEFAILTSTVVVLAGVVVLISMFSKPMKKGIETMTAMGIGYLFMSISMLIMYKTVEDVEWNEFGILAATVVVLGGIVILLGLMKNNVIVGATALVIMGIGYTLLSISMMIMYKAVEKASWEKFGMILATIGGMAVLTALMGIPVVAGLIALGSIAMGIMGLGLISLGVGVAMFGALVTDKAIDKVATGIPRILDAMTSMFKSSKENPSFGDSVMGIIIGALKLGGAIFAAGALILIGISLGLFAVCMKPWENFNKKSIDNVEYAVTKIYQIFDLDSKKSGGGLKGIGEGILGIIMAALKFGKTFFQMGTILLISFTMGFIYKSIMKWKDYDKSSMKNFEEVYLKLKEIFKLEDKGSSVGGLIDGIFGMAVAALQFGQTLFQMGTILLCVYTMNAVYNNLQKWSGFDLKSIENFEYVYNKIRKIFKLDESGSSVGGLIRGIFGLAKALLQFGTTMFQMGTILLCLYTMDYAYDKVGKWAKFDMKAIDNFSSVYNRLRRIFKLDEEKKKGIGGLLGGLLDMAGSMVGAGKTFFEMGTILMAVVTMGKVYDNIIKWKNYDPKSMQNFESVYNKLKNIFIFGSKNKGVKGLWGRIEDMAGAMLAHGTVFYQMGTILMAVVTMGKVYDNIKKWEKFNPTSIDNFEYAYSRMRRIFKFDEKKEKGIRGLLGGIEAMAGAMLDKGRMFFEMGTLLMAVVTMGKAYDHIVKWEKFNPTSIDNFEYAYGELRRIFKFDEKKEGGITGLLGGIEAMAGAMLDKGRMFFEMGTLLIAVVAMGKAYDHIVKWEKFNPTSIDNFEYAYGELRRIFKFDEKKEGGITGLLGGIEAMAGAMLDKGRMFFEMGTLLIAVVTMSKVYDNLKKWENFNNTSINNFEYAYDELRRIFKFDEPREDTGGIFGILGSAFEETLFAMANKNKIFSEMAIIGVAVKTMDWVYDRLKKWENFSDTSLKNFSNAYSKLRDIFKFDEPREDTGGIFGKWGSIFEDSICAMADKNKTIREMAIITIAVKTMDWVYDRLKKWENFSDTSLKNFSNAYSKLRDIFKFDEPREDTSGIFGRWGGAIDDWLCAAADKNKTFAEMATMSITVSTMSWIYDRLKKWESFNESSIDNFDKALFKIKNVLDRFGETEDMYNTKYQMEDLDDIMCTYISTVKKVSKNEKDILTFDRLTNVIRSTLSGWNIEEFEGKTGSIVRSLENIFDIVEEPGKRYRKNVDKTISLFRGLRHIENLNYAKTTKPLRTIIDKVNRLDIEKATALTDMFKSFANVREKSIFSSFQDSVEEFTEACIKLVDAINGNTDALNSGDNETSSSDGNTNTNANGSTEKRGTAVQLMNIDELAQAIAQRIGGGRTPNVISTVDLRINGQGGDSWTIRRGF